MSGVSEWWQEYWKKKEGRKKEQREEERRAGNKPRGRGRDKKILPPEPPPADPLLGEFVLPRGTDPAPEGKPIREREDPRVLARSVVNAVREAAPDYADALLLPELDFAPPGWAEKIAEASSKEGRDPKEWLAESVLNSAEALKELLLRPLYDLSEGDEGVRRAILEELAKDTHEPLKQACLALLGT